MPVAVRVRLRNKKHVRRAAVIHLAEAILSQLGECHTELGIELIGDRRMRRLNRQYRGKDYATDVLAFSLREAPGSPWSLLGDVVISVPAVARQAVQNRHSIDKEFAILLIHGILHLCGYDHERGKVAAERMQRQERMLLRRMHPIPSLIVEPRILRAKNNGGL